MEQTQKPVILYSAQRQIVCDIIRDEGVYFAKRRFVKSKYQESAPLFLAVYDWYVAQAAQVVPRPPEAEIAVWSFTDPANAYAGGDSRLLKLQVPPGQAVFFNMDDWTRLLNFDSLGGEDARQTYRKELEAQGIGDPFQVAISPFYPALKRRLLDSWTQLFRHHDDIAAGNLNAVPHVQAGLWCIRREWVMEDDHA